MRAISVLTAIITAALVFCTIASAAGGVPLEPGTGRTAGTIGGTIFLDADADGIQTAGEWGMSGVAVNLLDATGERVATAETFSHACEGLYLFSGVAPGNYTVEVVAPEGYAFTVVGNDTTGATASAVDPANGSVEIALTEDLIEESDLVVRDAGLVAAGA